jgi:uncharacterized membrane protein
MKRERIELMDALRGVAVVLMAAHHFLFDLVEFLGAPAWLFSNPVFDVLHYIFAGLFVLLAGVSSRFSRGNARRGLKVLAVALAISAVTWGMGRALETEITVRFGVLHLLGFCMVFYGLTRKVWEAREGALTGAVCAALLVASALAVKFVPLPGKYLWMLGWYAADFASADYFPIFPWIFVFLFGAWLGKYILERRFPAWFYEKKPPVFPAVGRKSLLIYIVHQPVLFGVTLLIGALLAK